VDSGGHWGAVNEGVMRGKVAGRAASLRATDAADAVTAFREGNLGSSQDKGKSIQGRGA
jgi:hypothetical protein